MGWSYLAPEEARQVSTSLKVIIMCTIHVNEVPSMIVSVHKLYTWHDAKM